MPGGPPPALPGDHSVILPSIASQTSIRQYFCFFLHKLSWQYFYISSSIADSQFSLNSKASPMNIPVKPMRPPMRSSIEGLNQEIEGLVLKSTSNTSDSDHTIEDKVIIVYFMWIVLNENDYFSKSTRDIESK